MDERVLVGLHTGDDAGVYRLTEDLALVQTVDFITPVVDDPYLYGQIAAANSLSDVYAMGAKPVTALNVVGYPTCDISPEVLGEILAGGASKVAEASASLVGGHTVDTPEPLYGLSVTGVVHPKRILSNAGARAGDLLVLTKPLGLGIAATAAKGGLATEETLREMGQVMATLNRAAGEQMTTFGAHAATDITGFGFAGHALALARESRAELAIRWSALPFVSGTREAFAMGLVPGGAYRNRDAYAAALVVSGEAAADRSLLLCDPQTSGGLLVALPPDRAEAYVSRLKEDGPSLATVIGEVRSGPPRLIVE